MMLDRPDLPDPLPWHSRLVLAVGRFMLILGVFAVIFGLLTLVFVLVSLLTGSMVLVIDSD
jgi:uncharacterized membrane protein HdeD (DUF308 family)